MGAPTMSSDTPPRRARGRALGLAALAALVAAVFAATPNAAPMRWGFLAVLAPIVGTWLWAAHRAVTRGFRWWLLVGALGALPSTIGEAVYGPAWNAHTRWRTTALWVGVVAAAGLAAGLAGAARARRAGPPAGA